MPTPARVPSELRSVPFVGSDAVARGLLTSRQLDGQLWRRLLRNVYVFHDVPDSLALRVQAVSLLLCAGAVVSGTTAAWVYGADVRRSHEPIEVTLPRDSPMRPRAGVRVRRAELTDADVAIYNGVPVTVPLRTGFDLARRIRPGLDITEGVVAVDALTHLLLFTPEELVDYGAQPRFFRWRGVRRVELVALQAEPLSESPGESRLRMRLVLSGFPRPVAQLKLYDGQGHHVARLDLAYRDQRIAVEYDGAVHAGRWRADTARRNRILSLGWEHYSYTTHDLRPGIQTVQAQIHRAIAAATKRPFPPFC